jgi:hypothetical protein
MMLFKLLTFTVVIVYFFESPLRSFGVRIPERIKQIAHFNDNKRKKKKEK